MMWQDYRSFIRSQKHWMLNQFQIIMGYIQLGKKDTAVEFIKRATSEVEGTAVFTQLEDAEFGVRTCLMWWRMRENNIILFPIIDKNISITNYEKVFQEFNLFMDDLKERYFELFADKHVTWHIKQQENKLISILKCDDECDLTDMYAQNSPFLGKVSVLDNCITYVIEL